MSAVIPFPGQPWTRQQLLTLYDMMERGLTLNQCAQRVGHSAGACDIAMWAILCTETVREALELLNGGEGSGGVRSPAAAAE